MLRLAKLFLRQILPRPVFARLQSAQRHIRFCRVAGFSEEERVIRRYLQELPVEKRYCVDIAAQDGIGGSQTAALFKQGWDGLAVEYDAAAFAVLAHFYKSFDGVSLVRTRVTPHNVRAILEACFCPSDFGFLSLDIDSYDHYVLDELLTGFRPALVCAEINEIVPPPIRFTVTFGANNVWEEGNHFQGQSIAKCHELCLKHGYDIIELHYNNVFLVPKETNPYPALSAEEAYDRGYRNKADRRRKFPWNADVEELLTLPTDAAIDVLHKRFAAYSGRYTLE
jgi:hypothetical protein